MNNEQIATMKKEMKLDSRLIGLTALNPFINYDSASRAVMFNGHLGQMLTLKKADTKIIMSGLEKELGKYTFSKKFENDSRVINILQRNEDYFIIYEDLIKREINLLEIPKNSDLHQYFGFEYKKNYNMNSLVNAAIEGGTVIADTPNKKIDGSYDFGLNLNYCLISLPETAEDAVMVSKSAIKRMGFKIYERISVEFGKDTFPLNLYGNDDNYKSFPEIGEYTHPSGVVMALRDKDVSLTPVLKSKKNLKDFNPMFDNGYYLHKGSSGKVVDIKAYYTTTNRKNKNKPELVESSPYKQVFKYVNKDLNFYNSLIGTYEDSKKDFKTRYGHNTDVKVGHNFSRFLMDAHAITNDNVRKVFKRDPLDVFRMEFTIELEPPVGKGFKITDLNGSLKK